jgi:hypothetical protein
MLIQTQNAMNAAEITDKLGLHSLRQRAWVSTSSTEPIYLLTLLSTFNPPVLPPEMVFTKVWSGLRALSERLVTSKVGVVYYPSIRLCFPRKLSHRTIANVHNLNLSSLSIIGAPSHQPFLSLQAVHFHKRRKGGYCTMNQATQVSLAFAFAYAFSQRDISRLWFSLFFPSAWFLASRLSYIWPCNLVFQHGIKAGGRWRITW